MQGTRIINETTSGNKFNQQKFINLSYLILGKVALANTNIKHIRQVFNPKNKAENEKILNTLCTSLEKVKLSVVTPTLPAASNVLLYK